MANARQGAQGDTGGRPKIVEAVVYMRQFPLQIEADLLFKGIDIADWHQGKMSSRRLLCLIAALDDDSAYWRERRDGDWSVKEYLDAAMVNELRLLRSDQAAIHRNEKMEVHLVESPSEQLKDEALVEKARDVRQHLITQLKGGKTE